MPKDQQSRRGVVVPARIIDPYQQEVALLLHKGSIWNEVWNPGDSLGYPCPIVTVNGQVKRC